MDYFYIYYNNLKENIFFGEKVLMIYLILFLFVEYLYLVEEYLNLYYFPDKGKDLCFDFG